MCERVRTMDKVTIAQIEGRVGGGGERVCFFHGYALWGLGEDCRKTNGSANGILPGGRVRKFSPLMGMEGLRGILGGEDLDAETAEKWGYLKRVSMPMR
ncbi:MAG: hypothetical protein Ct9H90mP27_7330 [Gammaproteobacteria bacterium]|nr:MAG: hypothetical protein Ct9H90mP27_7330 [Gammaproteobacteria bacterium]